MKKNRKVTINLPDELLQKAQKASQAGITETIKEGLELVAASSAYEKLRSLRGKLSLSVDIAKLRDDK